MAWSFRLFSVGGTVVRIHLAFFLLLAWVAAVSWGQGGPWGALDGVLFVVLVFACVVAHEFGHVFAARRYGIQTPDVTVLPIGGLARLERMPDKPGQELVVAIAGPMVNIAIAAVLLLVVGARFDLTDVGQLEAAQMSLAARLAAVNILLVVFNMIPAFPLDGGRVFRALLSYRMSRPQATRVAAWTGQAFAVAFAVIGLLYNPLLVLIAVFMFFAADAESGYETERAQAAGHVARDAMIARFEALSPSDTARRAADLLLATTQQEFPVLDGAGRLHGWVTRSGLVEALKRDGPEAHVGDFMAEPGEPVRAGLPLEQVVELLRKAPAQAVAVAGADGRVLGFVNRENLAEFFLLDEARARGPAARGAPAAP